MPRSRNTRKGHRRPRPKATVRKAQPGETRAPRPTDSLDISHALVAAAFKKVHLDEARRTAGSLQRFLPEEPQPGQVLEPEAAWNYLHQVRRAIEAEADELAQTYASTAWLWYCRRVPRSLFRGRLSTTEAADHAILETLTGLSRQADDSARQGGIERVYYDTSPVALRPVARMATLAVVLSQTHAWIRRAGKGTRFVVHPNELPEPVHDQPLEDAIELFDLRIDAATGEHWHPALVDYSEDAGTDLVLLGVASVVGDELELPTWSGRVDDQQIVNVRGRFVPQLITLQGLNDALAKMDDPGLWWEPGLPSLVILLAALLQGDVLLHSRHAGPTITRVAYLLRGRIWLTGMVDEALSNRRAEIEAMFPGGLPATGAEVLDEVIALSGSLWPHRHGPILRQVTHPELGEYSEQVLIDLLAGTKRLYELTSVPPTYGGRLVNANADRFELATQELVDGTPWRPSPSLAKLRGVHLRLRGQDITDIDALGERGGTLLLISCKNLAFTPNYDAGDYRTVRNYKTAVTDSVERWLEVEQILREHPVGDNYDFSAYDEFLSVVTTPQVFFSDDSKALRVLAEKGDTQLRRVSSLGEVSRFLRT